jgi:hypothetical protein
MLTRSGFRCGRYRDVAFILGASVGLAFPALHNGLPNGHDSYEHVSRYSSVARQFRAGEIYPRWLASMNSGLGSPALFVYGPLPYFVPSLLSRLLPLGFGKNDLLDLGISVWLALALSGMSAYFWLRSAASKRAATLASILYMVMPYHLTIDLYTRGAVAELWTFAWMPLALHFSAQLVRGRSRFAIVGLAVSYAAIIFTHLLITFIFTPVLLATTIGLASAGNRFAAIRNVGISLLLGIGLSAAYLLPALSHEKNVSSQRDYLAQTYDRNFLFTGGVWKAHSVNDRFLWKTSWLTFSTALAVIFAFLLIRLGPNGNGKPELFWTGAAAVSLLMMLPVSNLFWRVIPALPSIQFPWRFNTILALAAAMLLALAIDAVNRSWSAWRVLLAGGTACVTLLWAGVAAKEILFCTPWTPAMTRPFSDSLIPDWAVWTQPQFLTVQGLSKLNAQSTIREGLQGEISVYKWSPREITFTSNKKSDNWLIARRFYYPGWKAMTEGGRALSVGPSPGTGLIQVKVPRGMNRVHLTLPWGWTEKLGMGMTAFCGLLTCALMLSGFRGGFGKSARTICVNLEEIVT